MILLFDIGTASVYNVPTYNNTTRTQNSHLPVFAHARHLHGAESRRSSVFGEARVLSDITNKQPEKGTHDFAARYAV